MASQVGIHLFFELSEHFKTAKSLHACHSTQQKQVGHFQQLIILFISLLQQKTQKVSL